MAHVADKAAAASESSHFGETNPETEATNFTAKGKKNYISNCKHKIYIVREHCASQSLSILFSFIL